MNKRPTTEEVERFEQELLSGNDRAAIIVSAARLDVLLCEILEGFLLPPRLKSGEEDQLLSRMRPLSSFSSRIYVARRLGLIDTQIEDALHIIRDLRNEMAHQPFTNISLNKPPHKDRVKKLFGCLEQNDIVKFTWDVMGKQYPENYAGQCRIMIMMLLWALTQVRGQLKRIESKAPMTLRIVRHKRTLLPPSQAPP